MAIERLRIGEVARRTGVSVETVRYYEREGLLDPPARRPSGYRIYTQEAVRRIRFVKRAQQLGFPLRGIRELLALRRNPEGRAGDVKSAAALLVTEIEGRIRKLTRMRDSVQALERSCDGSGPVTGCSILEALDGEESGL
ncbi:MAG: heavy metal-responsive transcriptional regulator [Myxococcota bacterium]